MNTSQFAVYIAGDENTQFPALVAFKSLCDQNLEGVSLFYVAPLDKLDSKIVGEMRSIGVEVVDLAKIEGVEQIDRLGRMFETDEEGEMFEGRWPPHVWANWLVPEYLADRGVRYSLKLDYDVIAIGPVVDVLDLVNESFFCSAIRTKLPTSIPEVALLRIANEVGLDEPRKFSINSGVMLIDNERFKEINFFKTLRSVVEILTEECPDLRTIEQAAIALIASNYSDGFVTLPTKYNQRALARVLPAGFENDVRIVHYTRDKPWEPLDLERARVNAKLGYTVLPSYRNIWLEYAAKIDGFGEFSSQRPYDARALISVVSTAITLERENAAIKTEELVGKAPTKRRRELSELVADRLDWTVGYGPFKGLKMSQRTWWSRPSRGAMFLGIYEQEVLASLFDVPSNYDVFIDVGGADGYYAVGAVVSGRFKRCYSFEISEKGQELIAENAIANKVSDKVDIFGEADPSTIAAIDADDLASAVVMIDIEGAEFDLLTPALFEILSNNILIVELHPFLVENGDERVEQLIKASSATHVYQSMTTTARDMSVFPEVADLGDTDRWLICSEGRRELMTWLRFDPHPTGLRRLRAEAAEARTSEGRQQLWKKVRYHPATARQRRAVGKVLRAARRRLG